MKFLIFPYGDHVAQGLIVDDNYYELPYIESLVSSGTPFFLFDTDINHCPQDLDFFDAWNADFQYPDGYGSHLPLEQILLEKKQKPSEYLTRLEIFNAPKNKDIYINMSKARNIWRDKLRQERKPLLDILDVQYIRALEISDNKMMEKVAKKKQFLRDITEDPRIDNSQTDNDLREVVIPPNFIEE